MLPPRESSVIGVTNNMQGLFEEVMRQLRAEGGSDDEVESAKASSTVCRIALTGLLITPLLDKPEKTEKALFTWTIENGGVKVVISLN
jgi:hypothetical protein